MRPSPAAAPASASFPVDDGCASDWGTVTIAPTTSVPALKASVLLSAPSLLGERREHGEVIGQPCDDRAQVPLERPSPSFPHGSRSGRVALFPQLGGDHVLQGLAIRQEGLSPFPSAHEIGLVERQCVDECRDLDQAGVTPSASPGDSPSQSQPRLMTLPRVLTAIPRSSSARPSTRSRYPTPDALR